MTLELGSLLAGIAALIAAVVAAREAVRARGHARQAAEVSGVSIMESLKSEVSHILEAHRETVARHAEERTGLEQSIGRERMRAEASELAAISLRAEMAGLRIDLATARAELSELRTRFEATLATR